MKEYLFQTAAKHPLAAKLSFFFLFGSIYTLSLLSLSCPWWAILLIDLLVLVVAIGLVNTSYVYLMQPAVLALENECDPYPLREKTKELLTYPIPASQRTNVLINYAAALIECGEYQACLALLQGHNIDLDTAALPMTKFVYYNNLAAVCHCLKDSAAAELWHKKALQIYDAIPQKKIKTNLYPAILLSKAESLYRQGQYKECITLLEEHSPLSLRATVSNACLFAECSLACGDPLTARGKLNFVLQKGNRLQEVTRASALLAECERQMAENEEKNGKGDLQ